MIQLQINFRKSNKPTEAFYTQKGQIFQVYKPLNNVIMSQDKCIPFGN
jgi:hypothetical protein